MRSKQLFVIALALVISSQVSAGRYGPKSKDYFYDTADVVHVEPIKKIFEVREPERECWEEEAHLRSGGVYRRESSPYHAAGVITGGIIGGVVGNQFGSGSGNVAATVAGSILGATIGHGVMEEETHVYYEDNLVRYQPKTRRCQTYHHRYEEERIVGYRVTYSYRGHEFKTRTSRRPGDTMKVKVKLTPSL